MKAEGTSFRKSGEGHGSAPGAAAPGSGHADFARAVVPFLVVGLVEQTGALATGESLPLGPCLGSLALWAIVGILAGGVLAVVAGRAPEGRGEALAGLGGLAGALGLAALLLADREGLRDVPTMSGRGLGTLALAGLVPAVLVAVLGRWIDGRRSREVVLAAVCALAIEGGAWLLAPQPAQKVLRNPAVAATGLAGLVVLGFLAARATRPRPATGLGAVLLYAGIAGGLLAAHRGSERGIRLLAPLPSLAPLPGEPSLVVVTLDTIRRDHLGLYGYGRATTPRLEAFARDAVVYEDALSTSSWTLPAHASLFTGELPSLHGAHYPPEPIEGHDWSRLGDEATTVAELFGRRGFLTAAFVANAAYLQAGEGIEQGFQLYDDRISHRLGLPTAWLLVLQRVFPYEFLALTRRRYRAAGEVTDAALDWVRRQQPSRSFFLFVNYMDAHGPYWPPRPWRDRFPGRLDRFVDPDQDSEALFGKGGILPEVRTHLEALYDGGIAYVDAELGRLLQGLRDRDGLRRTWVVIVGDHGEMLGEEGLLGHGMTLREELVRIPLVLRPPEGGRSERRSGVVTIADVGRFLRALAAGDRPPLPRAGAGPRVVAENYVFPMYGRRDPERFGSVGRAAYTAVGRRKLVATVEGSARLYHLEEDPGEARDRSGDDPETKATLLEAVRAFVRGLPGGEDPARRRWRASGEAFDPAIFEDLGYTGRGAPADPRRP